MSLMIDLKFGTIDKKMFIYYSYFGLIDYTFFTVSLFIDLTIYRLSKLQYCYLRIESFQENTKVDMRFYLYIIWMNDCFRTLNLLIRLIWMIELWTAGIRKHTWDSD